MKLAAVALLGLVTIAVAAPAARQNDIGSPVEKSFGLGGRIDLRLAAATYRIQGWRENKIRIRWRTADSSVAHLVKADANITGRNAAIVTQVGTGTRGRSGIHFMIDVPERSDLDVTLSAGELDVRNIEGSKDVSSWAGDVSIDVGRKDLYRRVDASVRVGDLQARPFNVSKGGIMRSFRWSGHGPYWLRVRLFAGDLTLK